MFTLMLRICQLYEKNFNKHAYFKIHAFLGAYNDILLGILKQIPLLFRNKRSLGNKR